MGFTVDVAATILLKEISKKYRFTWALRNISLTIEEPSLVLIRGPNGSGKTTLLKVILGMVKPDYGEYKVFGLDPRRNIKRILKNLSFYFEDDPLPWWASGKEYLEFIANMNQYPLENIDWLVEEWRVDTYWDRKIYSYSSGMRRKIQILKAFLGNYRAILLDEPFTLLDKESVHVLIQYLKETKNKGIVIVASHIDEGLSKIADSIVDMRDGEIVQLEKRRDN